MACTSFLLLQMHQQVLLLVKEQVEKTINNCADNLSLLVSVFLVRVADAKLLDRTLSKLERDLKRTGAITEETEEA